MSNSAHVRRTLAIESARRAFLQGASIDHALGMAYNEGHLDGSEVASMTCLDLELCAAVAQLTTPELDQLEKVAPEVVEQERARRLAEINAEAN